MPRATTRPTSTTRSSRPSSACAARWTSTSRSANAAPPLAATPHALRRRDGAATGKKASAAAGRGVLYDAVDADGRTLATLRAIDRDALPARLLHAARARVDAEGVLAGGAARDLRGAQLLVVEGVEGLREAEGERIGEREGSSLVLVNAVVRERRGHPLDDVHYHAARWYYEAAQLNDDYAARLDEFMRNEGAHWGCVFYGGRRVRAAQARAAIGAPGVAPTARTLAGIADAAGDALAEPEADEAPLAGFAVDLARAIVPAALAAAGGTRAGGGGGVESMEGKVLWLLHETHGLALVQRWLDSPEGRPWRDTGRVRVFGAYRDADRRDVQDEVKEFLRSTFNAADNLHGERCKLFVGGAGDLGVGVTFSEVRHVVLDLQGSYFHTRQQMGRAVRLCQHKRLPDDEQRVRFHLPVPVLTPGWGGAPSALTTTLAQGGLGAARVRVDDFVERLRVKTKRQHALAPLHVPTHAFDTLCDLYRSRDSFLSGMDVFADAAFDADFYADKAGWRTPRKREVVGADDARGPPTARVVHAACATCCAPPSSATAPSRRATRRSGRRSAPSATATRSTTRRCCAPRPPSPRRRPRGRRARTSSARRTTSRRTRRARRARCSGRRRARARKRRSRTFAPSGRASTRQCYGAEIIRQQAYHGLVR